MMLARRAGSPLAAAATSARALGSVDTRWASVLQELLCPQISMTHHSPYVAAADAVSLSLLRCHSMTWAGLEEFAGSCGACLQDHHQHLSSAIHASVESAQTEEALRASASAQDLQSGPTPAGATSDLNQLVSCTCKTGWSAFRGFTWALLITPSQLTQECFC